ncbi:hypothetical protein SDJN02_02104, partial [Cucurbita argyrosperma subsp. argyrosperma]
MTDANTTIPCINLKALAVNHNINPDKRSNRESSVEAITASDLLSTEAYTFATKITMLAMLDAYIASLSRERKTRQTSVKGPGKQNSSMFSRHEGIFVTIPSVPAATPSGDKSSVLGLSVIFVLNPTKNLVKRKKSSVT